MSINVKYDSWILVSNNDGSLAHVSVEEAKKLPLSSLGYVRSEIKFAVLMLLIAIDNYSYNGINYLDDDNAEDGNRCDIAKLFLDSPGVATLKANKDHFVKRDSVITSICPQCYPAIAYAYTQFIGAGGRGYRPGAASNRSLYIVSGETIGDVIARNKINKASPQISRYFATPVYLRPVKSHTSCACDMCGKKANCYSEIYISVSPASPEINVPPHPHAAISANGKEASFAQWKTKFNAIANIADIEYGTPPDVVMNNAQEGDKLLFIGLENPQGSLRNFYSFSFQIPERKKWAGDAKIFTYVVRRLFEFKHKGKEFTPEAASSEYGLLSNLVVEQGNNILSAGIEILDSMFSTIESTIHVNADKLKLYVKTRTKFVNIRYGIAQRKENIRSKTTELETHNNLQALNSDNTGIYREILKKIKRQEQEDGDNPPV
ncbi:TPA: hypothetical protein R8E83_003566 [Escherichia coli]|nr:hypothetical protein [Escherichia coli]